MSTAPYRRGSKESHGRPHRQGRRRCRRRGGGALRRHLASGRPSDSPHPGRPKHRGHLVRPPATAPTRGDLSRGRTLALGAGPARGYAHLPAGRARPRRTRLPRCRGARRTRQSLAAAPGGQAARRGGGAGGGVALVTGGARPRRTGRRTGPAAAEEARGERAAAAAAALRAARAAGEPG